MLLRELTIIKVFIAPPPFTSPAHTARITIMVTEPHNVGQDFFSETPKGDKQRHNKVRQSDKSRSTTNCRREPWPNKKINSQTVKNTVTAGDHKQKTENSVVTQVSRLSVYFLKSPKFL